MRKILAGIPSQARLLDIGCGNGNLWLELTQRGFQGVYVGLDFSPHLLELASSTAEEVLSKRGAPQPPRFLLADLSEPGWRHKIPGSPFDFVTLFSVIHHLPGRARRLKLLQEAWALIADEGRLAVSAWQFLSSERLRSRIQDWTKAGLDAAQLEAGDYLLDWRDGGHGLRYVHHLTEQEFEELAVESGFRVLDSFYSDGEGSRLGLYQVWQPAN